LFVLALVLLTHLETGHLLTNGLISIGVSAAVLGLVAIADRSFIRNRVMMR